MISQEIVSWKSFDEGERWVRTHVARWTRPCVVLLEGPLGAGKTQVAKWIVQALTREEVTSPTFGIHHRYESPLGPIDHVDLYRLQSDADLESTGFWDLFTDDGFVIVEWADRLPESVWPLSWQKVKLRLSVQPDGSREVAYSSF